MKNEKWRSFDLKRAVGDIVVDQRHSIFPENRFVFGFAAETNFYFFIFCNRRHKRLPIKAFGRTVVRVQNVSENRVALDGDVDVVVVGARRVRRLVAVAIGRQRPPDELHVLSTKKKAHAHTQTKRSRGITRAPVLRRLGDRLERA